MKTKIKRVELHLKIEIQGFEDERARRGEVMIVFNFQLHNTGVLNQEVGCGERTSSLVSPRGFLQVYSKMRNELFL